MFKAFPAALIILLLFFSCKPGEKHKPADMRSIDSLISKYSAEKKIDSVFLIAEKKLTILKSQPDSIYAYVAFNQQLIELLFAVKREWPTTKKYYENIITLAEKHPADTTLQAVLTVAYDGWADGFVHKNNNPEDSTIRYFEKAIDLNHRTAALPLREQRYIYKTLGTLYNKLGDTKKALTYYELQKKIIDTTNNDSFAGVATNSSIALRESGLTDSAISIILHVLPLPDIKPLKRADLLNTLSEAQLSKGEKKEAEKNVLLSLAILDTLSVDDQVNEKLSMALKQKGILERETGQYDRSVETLKKSVAVYFKIKEPEKKRDAAKIYIELGKSHDATGAIDSALKYYQLALYTVSPADPHDIFSLPSLSQLYAENTIMDALDSKAEALVKKFRQTKQLQYLQTAVDCYDLSFETERKLMQYFSYDDSKLIMLKTSRERSNKAIDLCWQLQQLTKTTIWAEKAFLFAEISKAFVLLGSVKKNIAANTSLQDDSLYQSVLSLQIRLSYIEKKLFEDGLLKKDAVLTQLNKQKRELEGQLLLAETALSRNNSAYRAEMNKEDKVTIVDIKNRLLDNNTSVLEYFSGNSAAYMFSFTKTTTLVFLKLNDSLSSFTNSFLHFFTDKNIINNDPSAYQSAAYTLYQHLGFVSIDTSAIKQLIIIPDGNLNFVPFEALVTKLVPAQSPKNFSYLVRQQQISYGYSVGTLLKQLDYKASSSNTIAAFAPVFTAGERNQTPLPNTAEELNAIKNEKPGGKYFLEKEAVLNNFKNTIAASGIIHIATHASADTTGGNQPIIQFYDSTLYLQELYSMHINARLVVLSACETGIGTINKSEGAMSLARGFYYAGAKNIITSLWSVEDKSTAAIFSHFYHNISGDDYSLALYNAKLDYLKNASESNASPYYWAGFIHIGQPNRVRVKNNTPVIFLIIFVVAGLFFLLRTPKKQ